MDTSWPASDSMSHGMVPRLGDHASSPVLRPYSGINSPQVLSETGENGAKEEMLKSSKISAYARLDFDHYTFFVQTLQVVLGRKSNQEFLSSAHHSVDVHLSSKKAISRRHAKIFYNFGTQRFEISVLGRNGAFVNDVFIGKGITVPLLDSTKIQIGDIPFTFVLPSVVPSDSEDAKGGPTSKMFNPSDALNLRSNLYLGSSPLKKKGTKSVVQRCISNGSGVVTKFATDTTSVLGATATATSASASATSASATATESADAVAKKDPLETTQRRNSKADIVRRLSIARRKSLASSSNDEITALLKELETFHEGESGTSRLNDKDFDPSMLDDDMKQILHGSVQLTNTEFEKEDDEIDRLVKQHNIGKDGGLSHDKSPKDLALDINVLDQEVASLVPLIDGHAELSRNEKIQETDSNLFTQEKSGITKASALHHLDVLDRSSSTIGQSLPRMGKPATIQPPSNRVYGRASVVQPPMAHMNPQNPRNPQNTQNGYLSHISPMNGVLGRVSVGSATLGSESHQRSMESTNIPGHNSLSTLSGHPSGYHVTSTSGYPGYSGYASAYPAIIRPPPRRLDFEVETITCIPVTESVLAFRPITVNYGCLRRPPTCVYNTLAKTSSKPKVPIRRKDATRKIGKAQNVKDTPDQFKTKPTITISTMIATVLRSAGPDKKGFTTSEVLEKIKDFFPYYRYCPDGWQFPVTHNLKFNKTFIVVNRSGLEFEWQYAIDHSYIEEKEAVRKIQQETASARAKEAALRTADYRSRPMSYNHLSRPFVPLTERTHNHHHPQFSLPSGHALQIARSGTIPGLQRPKSIAEIASEIKRDIPHSFNKPPLYFQRNAAAARPSEPVASLVKDQERYGGTIKDQLAANRAKNLASLGSPTPVPQMGKPPSSANVATQNKGVTAMPKPSNTSPNAAHIAAAASATNTIVTGSPRSAPSLSTVPTSKPLPVPMDGETKKSLTYLQKELFTLYKARNLSYNTAVTTEIITKALATTIAQVNIIGAKAGCGDNALSFLVEKAPQQVSKILDIALTKSIKEKQSALSGRTSSNITPKPSNTLSRTSGSLGQPHPQGQVNVPNNSSKHGVPTSSNTSSLATHSTYGGSQNFIKSRGSYVGLSKPQSFTKPGTGLARPGQYINRPKIEKRPSDEADRDEKKLMKID